MLLLRRSQSGSGDAQSSGGGKLWALYAFCKRAAQLTHKKNEKHERKMRTRTLLIAMLALAPLTLWAPPARAGTQATLTLSGSVSKSATIAFDNSGATLTYSTLNIQGGESGTTVGTALEICNDHTGYKVTMASFNSPSGNALILKGGTSGNTDTITYTLTYGGNLVNFASGSATVTSPTAKTSSTGTSSAIKISFPAAWVNDDTYSDTLTFTIAAN